MSKINNEEEYLNIKRNLIIKKLKFRFIEEERNIKNAIDIINIDRVYGEKFNLKKEERDNIVISFFKNNEIKNINLLSFLIELKENFCSYSTNEKFFNKNLNYNSRLKKFLKRKIWNIRNGINKYKLYEEYTINYLMWNTNKLKQGLYNEIDIKFFRFYYKNYMEDYKNKLDKKIFKHEVNKLVNKEFDKVNYNRLYIICKKMIISEYINYSYYFITFLINLIKFIYYKELQNENMIFNVRFSNHEFKLKSEHFLDKKVPPQSRHIKNFYKKYYNIFWKIAINQCNLKLKDIKQLSFEEIIYPNNINILIKKYLYSKEAKEYFDKYPNEYSN